MKTVTVKQIRRPDCVHVGIHTFRRPEFLDPGFYRTMISYGAFFESIKGRNKSRSYLFLVKDDEFDFRNAWERARDAELPVTKHDNLYAFFDSIGYDRKTKTFPNDN